MAKDIGLHDFVKVKGIKGYEVVHKINGEEVTTVSISISEDRDTITYNANIRKISELSYVTDSMVNMIGPLYRVREELLYDQCERLIYGL